MAARKGWSELSPAYRQRLQRGGITEKQYTSGVPLSKARGHAKTPEHGIKDVIRRPAKFREYLNRNPQAEAQMINSIRDQAYENMVRRLGTYHSFKHKNVRANVYGGIRSWQHSDEPPEVEVPGMSLSEARWTATADTEAIRSRAADQQHTNPWWYH